MEGAVNKGRDSRDAQDSRDKQYSRDAQDDTSMSMSGTTASVAVLFRDHLLIANIGDSRVVICCTSESSIHSKYNSKIHSTRDTKNDTQHDAKRHSKYDTNHKRSSLRSRTRSGSRLYPASLTVDHTPYDEVEYRAVTARGGRNPTRNPPRNLLRLLSDRVHTSSCL